MRIFLDSPRIKQFCVRCFWLFDFSSDFSHLLAYGLTIPTLYVWTFDGSPFRCATPDCAEGVLGTLSIPLPEMETRQSSAAVITHHFIHPFVLATCVTNIRGQFNYMSRSIRRDCCSTPHIFAFGPALTISRHCHPVSRFPFAARRAVDEALRDAQARYTCQSCAKVWCVCCKTAWHEGSTCEAYQARCV